jgi:hypothetical protein
MSCNFGFSQIDEIAKVNHLLETTTYYDIKLDYKNTLMLPDSVKQKFISTLTGKVPQSVADSVLSISQQYKESIWKNSKNKCKGDSACMEKLYREEYQKEYDYKSKRLYDYYKVSKTLVLAAGSWNIREAIPILEQGIGDTKYDQTAVLMALAKLGNDSIKQLVVDKYTLPHILATTKLDTINDNEFTKGEVKCTDVLYHGIEVATYLQNQEILLNLTDLIYIRGKDDMNIGISYTVAWFISLFEDYNYKYFHELPKYSELEKICNDYTSSIWNYADRNLNKKEKQELQKLLSTAYRSEIRAQLREWIINNVNFD